MDGWMARVGLGSELESKRERVGKIGRESVCVCVCVCVRERVCGSLME